MTFEIENHINSSNLIINEGCGVHFLSFAKFKEWDMLDSVDWEYVASNILTSKNDFNYIKNNYIVLDVRKNCINNDINSCFWVGYLFNKNKNIDIFVGDSIDTLIDEVFSEYPYLFSDKIASHLVLDAKLNILNTYKNSTIAIVDSSCEQINLFDKNYEDIYFVGEYTSVGRLLKSVLTEEGKLFFKIKSLSSMDGFFNIFVFNNKKNVIEDIENIKLNDLAFKINAFCKE